jgi:hypothetical protein
MGELQRELAWKEEEVRRLVKNLARLTNEAAIEAVTREPSPSRAGPSARAGTTETPRARAPNRTAAGFGMV